MNRKSGAGIQVILERRLESAIKEAETSKCPTCNGTGMWYLQGDLHRSSGWVPCERCGGTGEKPKESKVTAAKKPAPGAGIHANPKSGKIEKILVGEPRRPVLVIEVELHHNPSLEGLNELMEHLDSLGTVTRAEIERMPSSLKLR